MTPVMRRTLLTEAEAACLRDLTNVAVLHASERLRRLLEVVVVPSPPHVSVLIPADIAMALQSLAREGEAQAVGVCQGFIGGGLAGEALLIFNDADHGDLAKLLKYDRCQDDKARHELLMDTANVLNGAFLRGLAEQLDTHFSFGSPMLLGQHCNISDLLQTANSRWRQAVVVEITYAIEHHRINCDLLLVIAENAVAGLVERLNYLLD